MKVLLIQDGMRPFGYELTDLKQAGLPPNVDLEILTVADLFLAPVYFADGDMAEVAYYYDNGLHRHYGVRYFAEISEQLTEASNRAAALARSAFPRWQVRNQVTDQFSVQAAIDFAMEYQPDLVLIGSHGLTWYERRELRRLTRRLVAEVNCSVRVTRPRKRTTGAPSRILIGYDGTRQAAAALEAVNRRVWPKGSEAFLVSCTEPMMTEDLTWSHDWVDADRLRVEAELAAAKARLERSGLKVTTLALFGNPAQTILDRTKSLGIDTIFLGCRELGFFAGLFSRSVSTTVATQADCSVEITKASRAAQSYCYEQRIAA